MYFVFLILLASDVCLAEKYNLQTLPNFITDLVLIEVRNYMLMENETTIPLPPIEVEFETKYIGIPISGRFQAEKGRFSNPATIEREGPSSIQRDKTGFKLSFSVGFKQMSVYFPLYTAQLAFASQTGDAYVGVGHNSVYIQLTVKLVPHCVVSLTKVKMSEFSDLDVRVTGLGILNVLENKIGEWLLESYRDSVTPIIEQVIQNKLQEEFAKTSLCKFKRI